MMDMARKSAIKNDRPFNEVLKETSKRIGDVGKGIVVTAAEQQALQSNFSEHGLKDNSWLDKKETITVRNEKDREKIIKQFGADRLDENGNLTLTRNEIFHDLIDKQLIDVEDAYRYREFMEQGMNVDDVLKILNTKAAYRGQEYYQEDDVEKYIEGLNSTVNAIALSRYDNEKDRARYRAKSMEEMAKVANTTRSVWMDQDIMERELKLIGSNNKEDMEKAVQKYGYDTYYRMKKDFDAGEINEVAKSIAQSYANASEQAGQMGGEAILEKRQWDVEELRNFKYTGAEMAEKLAGLDIVNTELQERTIYSLNEINHTIQEILQSVLATNPYTFKIFSALDSMGINLNDLPGIYFGVKMAGGAVKAVVKGVGAILTAISANNATNAAGEAVKSGVGGKLLGWLMGGGTGAKALVKGAVTKVAAPLAILTTLYQGFKGYQEAEELGAGKVNSTVSHMIGGDSSGVSGAVGNAMKWGATGALVGSVVPVLGTAVGGAIGTVAGAITGYIGGDKITTTLASIPNSINGAIKGFNLYMDELDIKIAEKRKKVADFMAERWEITKSELNEMWQGTLNFVNGGIDSIKNGYNYVVDSIVSGYDRFTGYISEKYNGIYDSVTGKFIEVKDSVSNFIQSIIDGMKDMYKSVTEKFSITYWKDKVFGKDEKEPEERERTKGLFGNVMDFIGLGGDSNTSKNSVVNQILKSEGGYVNDPNDKGGETKYGITKAKARELGYTGDMKDMPKNIAEKYYSGLYDKMQNKYGFDEKSTAMVTDLAVNSGEGRVKDMLAYSGGDYNKMLEWRTNYYNRIVEKDPSQKKFLKGWHNRLANLDESLGGNGVFNSIQPVSEKLMTLDTQKVVQMKEGELADSQSGNIELANMLGGILGRGNSEGNDNGDVVNAIGDTNSLLKLLVVALTKNPRTPGLAGY